MHGSLDLLDIFRIIYVEVTVFDVLQGVFISLDPVSIVQLSIYIDGISVKAGSHIFVLVYRHIVTEINKNIIHQG